MPAAPRETIIPGLAACQHCGFEARGAIRKSVRANRTTLSCDPCGMKGNGHVPAEAGVVAVWAPETSQAALVTLVRTAHVILHLHGAPVEAPAGSWGDGLDFDIETSTVIQVERNPIEERAATLVSGARRVLKATTVGRAYAMSLMAARLGTRSRMRPKGGDAEIGRRLGQGIRMVPDAIPSAEIERWIEGGGTYAGWTADTLAAQLS